MLDITVCHQISPYLELNSLDLIQSVNILCDLTLESKVLSKIDVRQGKQHNRHINDQPIVYKRLIVDLSPSIGRKVVNGSTEDNAIYKQLNNR
jgi:hypothetical protein